MLAITSKETLETLERWQFDIIREDDPDAVSSSTVPQGSSINGLPPGAKPKEKTEKEVQGEIREIMKQITASVTFLPTLEEECRSPTILARTHPADTRKGSFTLLAYTSTQDPPPLPEKWNDADPHLIDKGKVEQVRLRSFSTNVHKMEVSRRASGTDPCQRRADNSAGHGRVQDLRVAVRSVGGLYRHGDAGHMYAYAS